MVSGAKVLIYGDSIMKGTVMDASCRYHATMGDILEYFRAKYGVWAENRARFGSTIDRGCRTLQKDMEEGVTGDYALVEFGGNDCNFKWNEVAERPDQEHRPMTEPEVFRKTYLQMIRELQARGIKTVLMTLPPIDAERYLGFIARGGSDPNSILRWLGDVQMIYRFHESYSNMVRSIAEKTRSYLVDVRRYFLDKHNYKELICEDGLHPSEKGYALIVRAFEDFIAALTGGPAPAMA